jgi:CHASE3 domain sensor protein
MIMPEELRAKSTNRLLVLGLVVSCALITVSGLLAYRTEYQVADSFHWVSHTIEVQRQLEHLLSLIAEAETGTRGFLLTSTEDYLKPYWAARDRLPGQIALVQNLTADNIVQRSNLQQLEPLVGRKLQIMAEIVALQKRGDREGAINLVRTDAGKQAMDAIRDRLEAMNQEESHLLVERQEVLNSHVRLRTAFVCALVALDTVFVVAILFLVRRLAKLQHLVTICAWSRTVEYLGEWLSFEEYLHRRFNLDASHGISPAEAEKALNSVPRS